MKIIMTPERVLKMALRFERWAEDTMYEMQKPGLLPRLREMRAETRDEYLFVAQVLRERATSMEIQSVTSNKE